MQGLKDRTNAEIEELEQKIERINADIQQAKASIPEAQNVEAMIASDQIYIDIKNEIVELEISSKWMQRLWTCRNCNRRKEL